MRNDRDFLNRNHYLFKPRHELPRLDLPLSTTEPPFWNDWLSYWMDLTGYLAVAAALGVAIAIVAGWLT